MTIRSCFALLLLLSAVCCGCQTDVPVTPVTDHEQGPDVVTLRSVIGWYGDGAVSVSGNAFVMSGFRFKGQYYEPVNPVFRTQQSIASLHSDLGAETTHSADNWYAVFAAANDSGTASVPEVDVDRLPLVPAPALLPQSPFSGARLCLMPFLRIRDTAGPVLNLGQGGPNSDPLAPKTYAFSPDILAGCDVLVITEAQGSNPNRFSGRETVATGNTTSSVSVQDPDGIGVGDFILPSPPNSMFYVYLGSFCVDEAGNVMNIADSGSLVMSRMVRDTRTPINGHLDGVDVLLGGHIPPLATAVIFNLKQSVSSSATGAFSVLIGMDSSHDFLDVLNRKTELSTISTYDSGLIIPFLFLQKINLRSSGDVDAATAITRQVDIRGWIEP